MTIYIQNKKAYRHYISFGIKDECMKQIYLLSFGTEYFDLEGNTEFATMRGYFKHPKYWKNKLF